jgi:hypothetical protein
MSIAFFPLLLLALLVLGGGARAVYLVVHLIADKRPGAALTVLLGLAVMALLGILLLWVGSRAPVSTPHVATSQSMNHFGGGAHMAVRFGYGRLMMLSWPVIIAVVIGALLVIKQMRRSSVRGETRGGWGLPLFLLIALVMVVIAGLTYRRASYRQASLQQWGNAIQGPTGADESVVQLWDQRNAPRIQVAPNPSVHVNVPSPQLDLPAPPVVSSAPSEASAKTDKLLADMAKRIDSLARQYAVIAKNLAETGASTRDSAPPHTTATATTIASAEMSTDDQNTGGSPSARPQPPVESRAAEAETRSAVVEAETSDTPAPAEPRPAWVDDPPKRVGNTWREVVTAGEYATIDECYRTADDLLFVATWEHVQQLPGHASTTVSRSWSDVSSLGFRSIVPVARLQLQRMGVGIDYIRREIAKDEYVATADRSVGPMKTLYTLLQFSQSVDRELGQRWDAAQRQERFAVVGIVAGAVLSLVGAVYGLLKIDTWTKGYYTKRLFLGVPAVIIGIVALLVLLVGP